MHRPYFDKLNKIRREIYRINPNFGQSQDSLDNLLEIAKIVESGDVANCTELSYLVAAKLISLCKSLKFSIKKLLAGNHTYIEIDALGKKILLDPWAGMLMIDQMPYKCLGYAIFEMTGNLTDQQKTVAHVPLIENASKEERFITLFNSSSYE